MFTHGTLRCSLELVQKYPSTPGPNRNLEMLVFKESRKPEYPEKNLSEQCREPTTNSTHIWRRVWESNPRHIGGRRTLSPPWGISTPQDVGKQRKGTIRTLILVLVSQFFFGILWKFHLNIWRIFVVKSKFTFSESCCCVRRSGTQA